MRESLPDNNDCTFCLCVACDICHTGYGTNSITVGDTKYIFACDGCKDKLEKTSENHFDEEKYDRPDK